MASNRLPPVGVGFDIEPVNDACIVELVLECSDALLCPTWDNQERNEHLTSISKALASKTLPPRLRDLLSKAASALEAHSRINLIDIVTNSQSGDLQLAHELKAHVPLNMHCLYHGTVFARLAAIAAEGLSPGRPSNWKDMVAKEHLEGAVFFDHTWRGALDWAIVASARTKGPKTSRNRRPVVLRVRRGAYSVELDQKATKPGCFLVRERVCTSNADALVGLQRGIPKWRPLREIAQQN